MKQIEYEKEKMSELFDFQKIFKDKQRVAQMISLNRDNMTANRENLKINIDNNQYNDARIQELYIKIDQLYV